MTVGVPGGDAITWDIRYLASCGSNVQLSPHSIKIASAKEKIEQILLFSDESKCSVLQDKNIYISFSLYLTYLILFNDVENIILPSEDWWLHNRKNTYKLILSHIDYCVLGCIYDDDTDTTGCSQAKQTMNNWCWNGGAKPVDKLASKTENRLNWKLINSATRQWRKGLGLVEVRC